MENIINELKNNVPLDKVIIIFVVIGIIIGITFAMHMMKVKKARKELVELELRYNGVKGIPLAFKFNKAVALSRVNVDVQAQVEQCKNDFDAAQEELKECSVELAEIDDLLYERKAKAANQLLETLAESIDKCELNVNKLNLFLEKVLEQENQQREQINLLKESFRNLKREIHEKMATYQQSDEYLEASITGIEKMFSLFEEWMFASEFNKAADQQIEISNKLTELNILVSALPELYEKAKGVLPRTIDEVGFEYAQFKNKGVYLQHVEVEKNLEVITDMLKEDLNKLRTGILDNVEEDLNNCEVRLSQLHTQISAEEKAFEEVSSNTEQLYEKIKEVNKKIEENKKTYLRVCERFGFEDWNQKLTITDTELDQLNSDKRKLEQTIMSATVPYTTIVIAYKELASDEAELMTKVATMSDKLANACSDEDRAKKQLVKLQLIVNEIKVKIVKFRLPSVDVKYDEDINVANLYIHDIKTLLNITPLEVKTLNEKIRTAIDYIYTLYNNVNNLVGMANMVENTIVFGNRYRSSYSEIDSELTRAELCFRNGQYTKSLKIAIQAIEKLHPGSYENLIKENPGILNNEKNESRSI
ncbi:MAG: septation ring formation regulator EzrA [Erysipelotrichaceae bacterium]